MLAKYNEKLELMTIKRDLMKHSIIDFSNTHSDLLKAIYFKYASFIDYEESEKEGSVLFDEITKYIELKLSVREDEFQFFNLLRIYKMLIAGYFNISTNS